MLTNQSTLKICDSAFFPVANNQIGDPDFL